MAAVSWKNNSVGNWNTAANWSNTLVPTSADTITIGFGNRRQHLHGHRRRRQRQRQHPEDRRRHAGGNHPVTLSMVGNTLTVRHRLLNNDQSNISGFGTLSAGGAISGTGAITATGGMLGPHRRRLAEPVLTVTSRHAA